MTANRNPFAHLIPQGPQGQEGPPQPQQPPELNPDHPEPQQGNPFQKFVPQQPEQKEEMVDTFLGKLPRHAKEFEPGTPEFKQNMEDIMSSAVGGPGLKVVGKAAGGFGKGIWSLMNRRAPKELAQGIQKAHDIMHSKLSGMYDFVKDQALKRGIGKINVSSTLFDEAERHLPKTQRYKDLISKARNGDYQSLHELQSDLGKKGTASKGAQYHADRNAGEEMLDIRKQINRKIENHMKNTNNLDLADKLKEAREGYKGYKKLYYSHKGISNLVHPDIRKIPKNPMNLFTEDSTKMSRLVKAHPELEEALGHEKTAEEFLKKLRTGKKIGVGLGLLGGGLYGGKTLKDFLMDVGE